MPPIPDMFHAWGDAVGLHGSMVMVLLALFVTLIVCTLWRLTVIRIRGTEQGPQLKASLLTWWVLFVLIVAALAAGRAGVIVLTCAVSLLALREFLQLLPEHLRRGRSWLFVAVVLQYLWIYLQWGVLILAFIPVVVFLLLPLRAVWAGRVEGFITVYSWKLMGLMLTTVTLSHVPMVLELRGSHPADGPALLLFLLILTEGNDIAQSLWGRAFGRHNIVPRVSPNKALEGFIGGIATTVVLAMLLAPLLTTFADRSAFPEQVLSARIPWAIAALVGLIVALAGIAGDLTLSAIKRDAGVKDTGTLLPGHGGILDRVDSLLFSAPVFFWLMVVLYG